MVLQTLYKIHKKGFSLVEILIAISILTLISSVSVSVYNGVKSRNNLEIGASSIVEAIRLAKNNAEHTHSDVKWGVHITSEQLTVFAGNSYNSRNTGKDIELALPNGVSVSGLSEIVFEKVIGSTTDVGIITVSTADGSINLSINEKGTITYQ